MTSKPKPSPTPTPENFETSMKKLESIVDELEKGDFSLQESLEKFEEGLRLGQSCRETLDTAQARVKRLVEDPDRALPREATEE